MNRNYHFRTLLSFFFFMSLAIQIFGQTSKIPQITTQNGEKPIQLDEMTVKVKAIGNIATTTIEMIFYNPNNRILEGEFSFPLEEGQVVSGFGLDINGKLRDGVMVEKAKARAVYENTIKQRIDPGLIEKTVGNNYKTRIYPIPAKGFKRLSISFEQEIPFFKNAFIYSFPLTYNCVVKKVEIDLEIISSNNEKPTILQTPILLNLKAWQQVSKANSSQNDVFLNKNLEIQIPFFQKNVVFYSTLEEGSFFYLNLNEKLPNIKKDFSKIKHIEVYWDASLSRNEANIKKETDLLLAYLKRHPSIITIHTFAAYHFVSKTFDLSQISDIELYINKITYDGASDLNCLAAIKPKTKTDYFLFSDGIENFSKIKTLPVQFTIINSSAINNIGFLKNISTKKGHYIDLKHIEIEDAISLLDIEVYQFLGIKEEINACDLEIYTQNDVLKNSFFTLAGKWCGKNTKFTLQFGTSSKVLREEVVFLNQKEDLKNPLLARILAKNKIDFLSQNLQKNKPAIIDLSKKYSIVTDFTSLLVLDRIEDYVQNEIIPPAELLPQYQAMLQNKQQQRKFDEKAHLDNVFHDYQQRITWWNRDFKPKVIEVPAAKPSRNIPNPTGSLKQIRGKIIDSSNEPIPGVVIELVGANSGVNTDLKGEFTLNVHFGDVLRIQYIGFTTQELVISESNEYQIMLSEDSRALQEVVVTGYAEEAISSERLEKSDKKEEMPVDIEVSIAETTAKIKLKEWEPNTPYLQKLNASTEKEWDGIYQEFRKDYFKTPAFYLEIADFYIKKNQREKGLRVLSNLAEIALEDPLMLRILGQRLQQLKEIDKSVEIFEEVLSLRNDEPQSFRDLALAYKDAKKPQKAIENLYQIVKQQWNGNYAKINDFALFELNNIVNQTEESLNLDFIEKRLLKALPVQLRIVLNWSVPDCDLDLWVTDPSNERCTYSNQLTQIGSRFSGDCTQGYGPEEIILKVSPKGTYKIETNFFGSQLQKVYGSVTLQVEVYKNYGTKNETKENITIQLKDARETVLIGEINVQ